MDTFDVYGFESAEIYEIVKFIEEIHLLKFVAHDSEFLGDYFMAVDGSKKTYKLYMNRNGEDVHEEDHLDCEVILSVDYLDDSLAFMRRNLDSGLMARPLRRIELEGELVRRYRFQGDQPVLETVVTLQLKKN